MISLFFQSKHKKVYQLPHYSTQQGKWVGNTSVGLTEAQRAAKFGLDLPEYRRRVVAVAKEQAFSTVTAHDVMWPRKLEDALKWGKVRINGVTRHFDDYGTVEWHEPPFILSVSPINDLNTTFACTVAWVSRECPIIENQQEC